MTQNLVPNFFSGNYRSQTFGTITTFLAMEQNCGIHNKIVGFILHQRVKLLIKLQILIIKTVTILFIVV